MRILLKLARVTKMGKLRYYPHAYLAYDHVLGVARFPFSSLGEALVMLMVEQKRKTTKPVVERYWDWELTNWTHPIWLSNPKEITIEEYNELYKKLFNEYMETLASSHFTTE
ncbi:UNVERIFIED_CONTAM: Heat shock protein 90-6, mitochondrial, partial [Sesamum indicum]